MEIPPDILQKLRDSEDEAHEILETVWKDVTEFDTTQIDIRISSSSPMPLMTNEEQAQSLVFVVRYEHLPEISSYVAGRHPETGRYYLNEIDDIRAALNEYRTIFFNHNDGIHFGAITNLYQRRFCPEDPNRAPMIIQALTKEKKDLSAEYLNHLKSRKKAIRKAVEMSDFDFIYNGVLQHADGRHAMRMIKAYTDGSLAYLLLKNLTLAQGMKKLLNEHYKVIRILNFPRMGAL